MNAVTIPGARTVAYMLAAEVAAAWREYLEETRGLQWHRYEEVEPWAWTRLQRTLERIAERRPA